MKNKIDSGVCVVENERLATLESDMRHTQEDVGEIKSEIRDIAVSHKNIELAVVELAEIARSNQRVYPRLELLESQVKKNCQKISYWGGGLTALIFIATFFGSEIRTAMFPVKSPISQSSPVVQREHPKSIDQ